MKLFTALLACAVCSTVAFCESQMIVCGNSPGEIYFFGVHPTLPLLSGFYYSRDCGETIELIYSNPGFGLLADAQDSTLYGLNSVHQYLSTDGGYNWNIVNTNGMYCTYGSGVIPGEVYRSIYPSRLERSNNFGYDYIQCSSEGYPDSLDVGLIALGVDSGEVYLWTEYGTLYYSDDYGESFVFLNDPHSIWGVPIHYTTVINGAEPGELFVSKYWGIRDVWRIYAFGDSASLVFSFGDNLTYSGVAASSQPGELYFLCMFVQMSPGGIIWIYHTTDYFQTYTLYVHNIEPNSVDQRDNQHNSSVPEMQIFPNPANASFNISYELNAIQDVRLTIYDILGRQVWQNNIGTQSLGVHRLSFTDDQLPSGQYYLLLQSQQGQSAKTITIIK